MLGGLHRALGFRVRGSELTFGVKFGSGPSFEAAKSFRLAPSLHGLLPSK